jgi:FkbM family methyltransferase
MLKCSRNARLLLQRLAAGVEALLSDRVKDVTWYKGTGKKHTGSTYYKENTGHFADVEGHTRTTTTLDSLVESLGVGGFEYIKIDAQGAEIDILKGGANTVRSAEYVQLELPFGGEYNRNAPTFANYIKYMDDIGFTPIAEIEQHLMHTPAGHGYVIQIDFIFGRKTGAYVKGLQKAIDESGRKNGV